MDILTIGEKLFTLSTLANFLEKNPKIILSKISQENIRKSRMIVENIAGGKIPVYGINTGFGKLATHKISVDLLDKLQINLIRSHSVGIGNELTREEIRISILLLINSLSKGYSGVRLSLINGLIDLLNSDITPIVFEYGSLGASGDLVPLAHVALALIDEGPVRDRSGKRYDFLSQLQPEIIFKELKAKEGLALINGTHFTTALTSIQFIKFCNLLVQSHISFGLAIDALQASLNPFREEIHAIRPHPGQIQSAKIIEHILKDSKIASAHKNPLKDPRVQDPYSYRCFPQVMGGIIHVLNHARQVLEIELNSVTDNPVVIHGENSEILSGGNFHAEPVALVADYFGIAIAKTMNIMEKQVEKLLNPAYNHNLPAFLISNSGLNSGFMIAHYTQASLLNRVKLLSHPSSIDNISVSANQEDHVSMSMNAALKLKEISNLYEDFLALHFLVTSQGLSLRKEQLKLSSSHTNENTLQIIRKEISFLDVDRPIYTDSLKMKKLIKSNAFLNHIESEALVIFNKWLLSGKLSN